MSEMDESGTEEPGELQRRSGAAFDRIVGNSVNGGVVALLTTTTGSPEAASLVGGMLGPIAEEISYALRKVVGFRNRQVEAMVSQAAEEAGLSNETLLEDLVSDPTKMQLLVVALDSAGRSANAAKLRLISDLLATGALTSNKDIVSEQLLAIQAIGELDVPHFRLMLILIDPSPVWWESQTDRDKFRYAWPEDRITERDAGLARVLPNIAAKLASLGLARQVNLNDQTSETLWHLTSFGRVCMQAIRDRTKLQALL